LEYASYRSEFVRAPSMAPEGSIILSRLSLSSSRSISSGGTERQSVRLSGRRAAIGAVALWCGEGTEVLGCGVGYEPTVGCLSLTALYRFLRR
jgi:hypothetical protein